MDTFAGAGPGVSPFGTGRLIVADTRLGLGVLNYARHQALARVFGVSREQANLLTLVLALGAAEGTAVLTARIVGPLRLSGTGMAAGGFAMREGTLGLAGPAARQVPRAATLLAFAMVGGIALPRLRQLAVAARAAEHRARTHRLVRYAAARRPTQT